MKNSDQVSADKCINFELTQHLPADYNVALRKLIEELQTEIVSLYQAKLYQRRRANAFKVILKAQGFLTHNFAKENSERTPCQRTIKNRISYVKKNIAHHDSTVGDAIQFVSLFTKNYIKNNEEARVMIANDLNKIWLREQKLLNQKIDNNWDDLCNIVFGGLIQGWSRRDFDKFNQIVCNNCVVYEQ